MKLLFLFLMFSPQFALGQQVGEDAVAYVERGIICYEKGEYDKAIKNHTEAIKIQPDFASAYGHRGMAWQKKFDYDKAIKDYTEAVRLDPRNSKVYCLRGSAWDRKGKYDKAIKDYTEAIKIDPKFAVAYYDRGMAWHKKGQYDQAIKDYTEAIRIDPDYSSAYHIRGIAWNGKNEYDKAIKDYNEAIRINPKRARAYSNLASLQATCPDSKFRDGPQAVENGLKACELTDWKDDHTITSLATAYAEAGDFREAIKWLNKANEMNPDLQTRRQKYENQFMLGKPYRSK